MRCAISAFTWRSFDLTIYDVAKQAGVSIATVSRVINNRDNVTPRTRRHVLDTIEKVGYTPNVFARGMGIHSMRTVGILVPDISDAYMAMAVSHLEEHLWTAGYGSILGCSGFDPGGCRAHVQMMLSKGVDALIMVGSFFSGNGKDETQTAYIREASVHIPVFMTNGIVEGNDIFCNVNTDREIMRDVTSAMIRRGRKRILFLTDSDSLSARNKCAGYEQALMEADLPIYGELKIHTVNRIHHVRDLLLQYKNLSFDGVVATEDGMAVGAIKYAKIRGMRIPEDVSIVGYNNSVLSVSCEPELTSVDNHAKQMCIETVKRILQILEKGEPPAKCVTYTCELVRRQTTDF